MTTPPPPPSPPPASGPPPVTAAELRGWLDRRRRARGRLKAAVAIGMAGVVGLLATAWTCFHAQWIAIGSLQAASFVVDWDLNLENLLQGGKTSVVFMGDSRSSWNDRNECPIDEFRPLEALNHVVRLDLARMRVVDPEKLAVVGRLTDLEELDLGRIPLPQLGQEQRPPLTDAALAPLAGLKRLKVVGLADNRITDAGLDVIAGFPDLEYLDLDGTLISDSGLAKLKGLTRLKTLRVVKTGVTPTGVNLFQRERSDTEVTVENVAIEGAAP